MIIGVSGKINSGKDTIGSIIQYLYYEHSDINIDNKLSYEEFVKTNRTNNILISSVVPEIKKYADKLKDIVCILLSCTREQLEDREFKETQLGEEWTRYGYANGFWIHSDNNPSHKMMDNKSCDKETYEAEKRTNWQTAYKRELTPRLLLQLLGTECGRQIIHPNIWVNATMADYKENLKKDSNYDLGDVLTDIKHLGKPYPPLEYPNWIITDVRFPNEADAITKRGGINIRINKLGDGIYEQVLHASETSLDNYKFDYVVNHGTIEALIEQVREILIKENII